MTIKQAIMTKNPCYTTEGNRSKTKGLMLHSVGCAQPSAEVFINGWNKESYNRACVHGFIDANTGVIYQTLPWDHIGWHGGKPESNLYYIGVEMCESTYVTYKANSASFTIQTGKKKAAQADAKRAYNAAVELFAMLCNKYSLDPLKSIVSHSEGFKMGIASNHSDPEHYWKGLGLTYTMDGFRKAVKAKMGSAPAVNPAPQPATKFPYMVKVNVDALNVRKGAGAGYAIVNCIKDRGSYTIVDEKTAADGGKWGLLKAYRSGRNGWINLYYTKKI